MILNNVMNLPFTAAPNIGNLDIRIAIHSKHTSIRSLAERHLASGCKCYASFNYNTFCSTQKDMVNLGLEVENLTSKYENEK